MGAAQLGGDYSYLSRPMQPQLKLGALTANEVQKILTATKTIGPSWWDQSDLSPKVRSANAYWIERATGTQWLFDQIQAVFTDCNQYFGFEIESIQEPLFVAEYGVDDHFTWHCDTGPGITARRKLSVSIALSDQASYTGGELEFNPGGSMQSEVNLGSAIVFPGFMAHRVKPITSGVRRALVGFIHGPPFK
jgi:PKHD-type hydroxylase